MHPILASDFGNLGTLVLGVPVLLLAVPMGILGLATRARTMTLVSGVACLLVGVLFLWSMPAAIQNERWATPELMVVAFAAGVVFVFVKR